MRKRGATYLRWYHRLRFPEQLIVFIAAPVIFLLYVFLADAALNFRGW